MTPDNGHARQSIMAALSQYNIAGDQGDYQRAVRSFHEQGRIEFANGNVLVGRADIAAFLAKLSRDRTLPYGGDIFQRHHLSTCSVEFSAPDLAESVTYFSVLTEIGLDHFGVYSDRFAKTADGWLILRRRIRIDFVREDSRFARAGMKVSGR